VIVVIINRENATNTNEISELTKMIFEKRMPIPTEIDTIKNILNLYPIF